MLMLLVLSFGKELSVKKEMVKRHRKGSDDSSFYGLLPAQKQQRIQLYKDLPKVKTWLTDGKEVATGLR